MAGVSVLTSRDIYIEVAGQKAAVVQSCIMKSVRTAKSIEAFGSEYPVASVGGKITHELELRKVVVLSDALPLDADFYALEDFTVNIVKPDHTIVYSGCEWQSIGEEISLSAPCIETVKVLAAKRVVL